MTTVEDVTREEAIRRFCERQKATPVEVERSLASIEANREVEGWMLLECVMLDSSRLGELTLLPFGPGCTYKDVATHPISPRGLASDMSVVAAVVRTKNGTQAGPVS